MSAAFFQLRTAKFHLLLALTLTSHVSLLYFDYFLVLFGLHRLLAFLEL